MHGVLHISLKKLIIYTENVRYWGRANLFKGLKRVSVPHTPVVDCTPRY